MYKRQVLLGLPVEPVCVWLLAVDTLPVIPGVTGVLPLLGVTAPDEPPKAP